MKIHTAGWKFKQIAHEQGKFSNSSGSAPALRTYLCSVAHRFPLQNHLSPASWLKFRKPYQKSMKIATRLQKLPSTNTSFSPHALNNLKKFEKQSQSRIQPDLNPRPRDRESRTLRTTPPRTRAKRRGKARHLCLLVFNRTLRVKFAHFPAFPPVGKLLKPCSNGNDVTMTQSPQSVSSLCTALGSFLAITFERFVRFDSNFWGKTG